MKYLLAFPPLSNSGYPSGSGSVRIELGYGVIGSPSDSGSDSLGSSPGTPAQYKHDSFNYIGTK